MSPNYRHHSMIIFHGGCIGCTQQWYNGVDFCFDCCYFNADWKKPDLSNKPPSNVDPARFAVADPARLAVVARRNAGNFTLPDHGHSMPNRRDTNVLSLITCVLVDALCFLAFLGIMLSADATAIQKAQSALLWATASSVNHLAHGKQ